MNIKKALLLFIILLPHLTFPQWGILNTGTTTNFNSIYVIDSLNTITVGDSGKIYKTVDGGSSWARQSAGLTNEYLTSVFFINSTLGYITGSNGLLLKTSNGGSQWQKSTISTYNLNDIYFKNSSNGLIVSENGIIYKTNDAGSNWTEVFSGSIYFLNSIRFTDDMNGFIAGNSGTLLKTTDGGASWKNCNTQTTTTLNDVFFINKDTGLSVGLNQTILKTTNGAQSFLPISSGFGDHFYALHCFTNQDCYVTANNGTIIKIDKMGNVSKEISYSTNSFKAVGFYNRYIGYSTGSNGIMLKTCPVSEFRATSYNDSVNFSGNVLFTNRSRNYTKQTWFFGDGNSSVEKSPTYNYKQIGDYQVKLITENQSNCKDTIIKFIKVKEILGLKEEQTQANIIITPNPFVYAFTIDIALNNSYVKMIEIYCPTGKCVYKKQIKEKYYSAFHINLEKEISELKSGVYILNITTDKNSIFRKIMKI